MLAKAAQILEKASDKALATVLLDTFREVEKNYFLRSWKTSELDAGHFVEASRRFINHRLFGSYTAIGANLGKFNEQELKRLEGATGSEAYRLHIPRAMFAIYGLRNKRGVGHLGTVNPNYLDATFILATCKWVLGEFLRTESTLTFDETVAIVEQIVERPIASVWEVGDRRRILVGGLSLKEQAIFLLYIQSPQPTDRLFKDIGCSDLNYFRKQLKQLHESRIIELAPDGTCSLSPLGIKRAEQIVLNNSNPA